MHHYKPNINKKFAILIWSRKVISLQVIGSVEAEGLKKDDIDEFAKIIDRVLTTPNKSDSVCYK